MFRDAIRPGSAANPFREKHRVRNHALLLCYLDLGLRLSEALNIKGADLLLDGPKPIVTIHRRADAPDDPRGVQPLTKTRSRILPIGEELRAALLAWIEANRTDDARYPGAKKTGYVFVSEEGTPIGVRTVGEMFDLLRAQVTGLTRLTAHPLRHTWNDNFSKVADETGMTEAEEIKERCYLMGWSPTSKQAANYTRRHTREAAAETSLRMQRKSAEGRNR